jgi:hypothetical protein
MLSCRATISYNLWRESFNFFKIVIFHTSIPMKGIKMVEGIGLENSILLIQKDVKRVEED